MSQSTLQLSRSGDDRGLMRADETSGCYFGVWLSMYGTTWLAIQSLTGSL